MLNSLLWDIKQKCTSLKTTTHKCLIKGLVVASYDTQSLKLPAESLLIGEKLTRLKSKYINIFFKSYLNKWRSTIQVERPWNNWAVTMTSHCDVLLCSCVISALWQTLPITNNGILGTSQIMGSRYLRANSTTCFSVYPAQSQSNQLIKGLMIKGK